MSLKKLISIMLVAICLIFSLRFLDTTANASNWHEGNPPEIDGHTWTSDFYKFKDGNYHRYYYRYQGEAGKDMAFYGITLIYNKNKKMVDNAPEPNDPTVYHPYYKRIDKKLYKEVSGGKQRVKGFYRIFKIYSSNKFSVQNYVKGKNYLYHKNGQVIIFHK